MKKYLIATLFLLSPSVCFAALTDNLVAYWKLDETSGTRMDETANNNDLTDNNTVLYGAGIIGNAADFELDNSEYLSITDAAQTGLGLTSSFTLSFWVKLESQPGATMQFLGKRGGSYDGYSYKYYISGSNYWSYASVLKGSSPEQTYDYTSDTTATYPTGTWKHVVFILSAGSYGDIYINGTRVLNDTTGTVAPYDLNAQFLIGALNDTINPVNQFTDGLIDEVGVWSRAITSTEVTELYNSGSGLTYPFSSGGGTPAPDDGFIFFMYAPLPDRFIV